MLSEYLVSQAYISHHTVYLYRLESFGITIVPGHILQLLSALEPGQFGMLLLLFVPLAPPWLIYLHETAFQECFQDHMKEGAQYITSKIMSSMPLIQNRTLISQLNGEPQKYVSSSHSQDGEGRLSGLEGRI